jgi:hypothetical protein
MLAVGSFGVEHVYRSDAGLKTCILSNSSPSKALYAGWPVEGNLLQINATATEAYDQYQQNRLRNSGPINGAGIPPSLRLQMKLAKLSATSPTPPVIVPSR